MDLPEYVEDVTGQQVRVGDHIAYAVTAGRSADLALGEILNFQYSQEKDWATGDYVLKIRVRKYVGRHLWSDSKPGLLDSRLKRFVKIPTPNTVESDSQ